MKHLLIKPITVLPLILSVGFIFWGCTITLEQQGNQNGAANNTIEITKKANYSLYETPPDFQDDSLFNSVISSYSGVFKGKTFFLDPGHGGTDRNSKSPNGLVTEADINLRVALYLRDMLRAAGANVLMSRETDATVELKKRPEMANKSNAGFFISIHHNAPGKPTDRFSNYTSTYYHATEADYEHHPSNRDMAKYVNRELAFNIGRPAGLASFDGTISDYLIYPGDGFAVLRLINIPAILVECSFFTNLNEEIRLADSLYNKLEAYGIFKGLGKYFKAPIPTLQLTKKEITKGKVTAVINVSSKQPIEKYNIKVFANKTPLPADKIEFDKNILTIDLGDAYKRETEVKVIVTNNSGLSNLPFIFYIIPEAN
ncbi:MAG: N-acetylmuramoyl-L-alanine amidase [Ignavibacteriales bacterium]|nr:MAG: N-acetylmuramoyl-L-alanine amidase [Ignavibacteriaceae bacterium]MBW7872539.1 N-acetylmuramoyl-L-alanine amidase [Ignavibacteria bacterium]MCZ2141908.1 N-acetylmuramoyl-L-alanine amidase [Ignavibacteriales bacterium]OQY79526.1 MAG: hypothetical protein B6D45_00620 [Ignavibacteriales bacterium UTCHB3]MBV6445075.1 hypothetical protein [Ignavibacteriaceae bacterium]